jgi:hypothetical protein
VCAQQLGHSHPRLDAILMEAVAGPCTGKEHPACALDIRQLGLGCIGCSTANRGRQEVEDSMRQGHTKLQVRPSCKWLTCRCRPA